MLQETIIIHMGQPKNATFGPKNSLKQTCTLRAKNNPRHPFIFEWALSHWAPRIQPMQFMFSDQLCGLDTLAKKIKKGKLMD